MKILKRVVSDITLVIDDYETGTVLYEGPIAHVTEDGELCNMCALNFIEDAFYKMETPAIEWVVGRNGRHVALMTVRLNGEQLEALLEYRKASEEYSSYFRVPITPEDDIEEVTKECERLTSLLDTASAKWRDVTNQ